MAKLEALLDAARADLVNAETALAINVANEADALGSGATYSTWRAANESAKAEVERLQRWIAKITTDVEAAAKNKADEAQAALEADADRTAEAAKAVIIEKLEVMHDAARKIMAAIASSDAKISLANRGRRSDLPPLESAESRARRGERLERKVITEREFEAWSFQGDRRPLGEEQSDRVTGRGTRGQLRTDSGSHDVIRRRFLEVRYLPEIAPTFFEPIADVLSVPPIRAGGAPGWTPAKHATSPDIHRQLDELSGMATEPDRRRPQVEIICLGDVATDVAA